jgi:hypothetical protein
MPEQDRAMSATKHGAARKRSVALAAISTVGVALMVMLAVRALSPRTDSAREVSPKQAATQAAATPAAGPVLDCPAGPQDIGRTFTTRAAGAKGAATRKDAAEQAARSFLRQFDDLRDEGGPYSVRYQGKRIARFTPDRDDQGWFVDDILTCTQYLKD